MNIHLLMPFSRYHLWPTLIEKYRAMNVILHPLLFNGESLPFPLEDWVIPYVAPVIQQGNALETQGTSIIALINSFLDTNILIDDDYYVIVPDDDMYDDDVMNVIRLHTSPVVFISMKRGYRTPCGLPVEKQYPVTTLLACSDNVKIGSIGGEQIFTKGSVLKSFRFDETSPVADGLFAIWLKKNYQITYEPRAFALFNFYELGRWDKLDGGLAFGVMVNDSLRLEMCLKQSQIDPTIPCHTILNPESATEGLNKLLDIIENTGADVAVLVHQDMYFRNGWTNQVKSQIKLLPSDWIVAGVIGKDHDGLICGKFHDMRIPNHFDTSDIHRFPHPACCFDEAVIIINLKTGFRFDEMLDSFDLYGTLAVLQAWEMGGTAWIIDAFCEHYCMRSFQWFPSERFRQNYKTLFDRFNGMKLDSTALGLSPDATERLEQLRAFMTSAAPESEVA